MRLRPLLLLPLFALPLLAGACSTVQKAEYLPPIPPPADAHPAPIGFSGYELDLPLGQDIGVLAEDVGPFFCSWPYSEADRTLLRNQLSSSEGIKDEIKTIFRDALTGEGYDVTGTLDFDFPENFGDEDARSEYKVGGKVRAAQIHACYKAPSMLQMVMGAPVAYEGELYIRVDWSLYDALRRGVVYRTHSEGYSKRHQPAQEGVALMFEEAFGMAAHNLGTDPAFHDLIFNGKKPADDGGDHMAAEKQENRPRLFDPREKVELADTPLSRKSFTLNAEQGRRLAVMIETGNGSGSGFFIDPRGYILTNAHVVGGALRVRVVTADKEEKLVAEVLRRDATRDVALLKLESVPEDMKIVTRPIRTEIPQVSEPVYLIGSPHGKRYQDTVRAGIVSAYRKDYKALGTRQNYIQSDVPSQPGNSGGPLLDGNGNIIGLADLGVNADDGDGLSGLNFFIPVGEALQALDIDLGGAEAPVPLKAGK